jgi:hypothetical protein
MQIHAIVQSLKQIASEAPMAAALGTAGFVGDIEHGTDASIDAPRPFGLLTVAQTGVEGNSSGVRLVTYVAVLQVYGDENVTLIGNILNVFHRYWDQISGMPSLDPVLAKFVQIHPTTAELGETDDKNLGKDTLLGDTAWEIQIKETQPALE